MTNNMAMLGESIFLVQSHLSSIDNRLPNLEGLNSPPQNGMADLSKLDFTSVEHDFVSTEAVGEDIYPSHYSVTPSSQSLPSPSSPMSPLIDSLPHKQQMKIKSLPDRDANQTSYVRGCMDITVTEE